jgi:hypothetical protein
MLSVGSVSDFTGPVLYRNVFPFFTVVRNTHR